jgi:Flp pilus assembly protein TadD
MITRHSMLCVIVALGLAGVAAAQPQVFYQRYQTGRAQLDQTQFDAAVASLNSALAAVPAGQVPDPNIYVALGYAQMRLGHLDDANVSFNFAQQALGKLTPASRQQLQVNKEVLLKLRGH